MSQTVAPNGTATGEFSVEQKEYLNGFLAGANAGVSAGALAGRGVTTWAGTLAANGHEAAAPVAVTPRIEGPDALALEAALAQECAGKKLVPEEKAKRELHPFERWDQMVAHAEKGEYPKGTDVLMWKYHGLFYVAPAQDSFMCRLRFYGGLISSDQLRCVARLAQKFGGGYVDCTTRGNLQIREIKAPDAIDFLESLQEAGLVARGSGADNIRNITGSATAGIDPQELYDVRDLCRQMHHYILNHREMYGLPRKFNISFDGGGQIPTLEETNDIGFLAVEVKRETLYGQGKSIPAGVYFRVAFGGITGHKDFARDEGILLHPAQLVSFAAAAVRVFIKNGNRSDRKKARLKYLLDEWGHEKFLAEVVKEWPNLQHEKGEEPIQLSLDKCEPRPETSKIAHIGWHRQKQEGLNWLGVVLPVGRMSCEQMRGLARIAGDCGSGDLRLTVWQNLLICDVPDAKKDAVEAEILGLGLDFKASGVRSGLVACTGNAGCKYANANTKKHAMQIAEYLENHLGAALNEVKDFNLHVTGCPNSCAQHYIGDVGLLGTKVDNPDDPDGEMLEGYHLFIGGGFGDEQNVGRELVRSLPAEDVPRVMQKLLEAFLATRDDETQSFFRWSQTRSTLELQSYLASDPEDAVKTTTEVA